MLALVSLFLMIQYSNDWL